MKAPDGKVVSIPAVIPILFTCVVLAQIPPQVMLPYTSTPALVFLIIIQLTASIILGIS